MAELQKTDESFLVLWSKQMSLQGIHEEDLNIVPIIFDYLFSCNKVSVPMSFQLPRKDGKLLIVNISLYRGFSLEAVNNKLQTYLGISHAGRSILFFKLCHAFLTDLPIFFIDLLDKFFYFLISQLQIIDIIWVEEQY